MTVLNASPLLLREVAADDDYQIERSVRFNTADDPWLKKVDTKGDRRRWTWSGWVKKSNFAAAQCIFSGTVSTGYGKSGSLEVRIVSGHHLYIQLCEVDNQSLQWTAEGKAFYRDGAAWQHWVVCMDTSSPINDNRIQAYVNGKRITSWAGTATLTQDFEFGLNKAGAYNLLGVYYSGEQLQEHFDGYFADVIFLDGLVVSPAAFGELDSTGAWKAKVVYDDDGNLKLPERNQNVTYSNNLSISSGSITNATQAFRGKYGSWGPSLTAGSSTLLTLTPADEIDCHVGVDVGNWGMGGNIYINKGEWDEVKAAIAPVGTYHAYCPAPKSRKIKTIGVEVTSGTMALTGFKVDGVELRDGHTDVTIRDNPNNGTTWSNYLTSSTGSFHGTHGPTNMFNGSTNGNNTNGSTSSATITFTPPSAISGTSVGFSIDGNRDPVVTWDDDSTTTFDVSQFQVENHPFPSGKKLKSILFDTAGGSWTAIRQLYINGHALIDGADDNSFHLKFDDSTSVATLGKDSLNSNDFTVYNLAFASAVRTVANADAATKPFYQTTGDQGGTKVSPTAYNTDSSAGTTDGTGLVFALPGDVLTDEHDHVNTGSSAKTVGTANSIATTTSDSRFYGTSIDFGAYDVAKRLHVTKANAGSDFNFGTGGFTVECWFKQTDQTLNSGSPQTIFDFDADEGYGGGWLWLATNATNLVFYYSDSASSLGYVTVMAKDELLNNWTHFACAYDTSANKLRTFINGEVKNEISYALNWTGDRGVYLGQMNLSGDQNRTFAGLMNDFRVYKGVTKYTANFNPPAVGDVAGNDYLVDTPTNYSPESGEDSTGGVTRGNYCTWNPLTNNGTKLSQGNLATLHETNTSWSTLIGTMSVSGGKWYYEYTCTSETEGNDGHQIGWVNANKSDPTTSAGDSGSYIYYNIGKTRTGGTDSNTGYNTWSTGDTIGVALDLDAGKLYFAKNNTWEGSSNPATGANAAFTGLSGFMVPVLSNWSDGNHKHGGDVNFGQRAFTYTAPTGFKTLCTQNLPDSLSGAAKNNPSKYFDVTAYTGNSAANARKGFNFSPDFIWIKSRSQSGSDSIIFDQARGVNKSISSHSAGYEDYFSAHHNQTSFDSNGFTLGASSNAFDLINKDNETYVSWAWDCGTSAATASTDGSITPSAQWVNTDAGFSITKFTGTGSAATVGHALGNKPGLVMIKNLDSTGVGASENWQVWIDGMGTNQVWYLNTKDDIDTSTTAWNNSAFDGDVVHIGANDSTNHSAESHIMYAWTAIHGYSAFGYYTGTGNNPNFCHLGFKPNFLMVRGNIQGENWIIWDGERKPYNIEAQVKALRTSDTAAESSYSGFKKDFLSNGFRTDATDDLVNKDGTRFYFAAFAEQPFKNARGQ